MGAQAVSWWCGNVRTEARIIGNRVTGYRYVVVNGCGSLNRPDAKQCTECGREKQ